MEETILSQEVLSRINALEKAEAGLPSTGALQNLKNLSLGNITSISKQGNSAAVAFRTLGVEDVALGTPVSISGTASAEPEPLNATPSNELIVGTDQIDEIFAQEGDDLVFGLLGDDKIFGAAGQDNIVGGGGNDFINGDDGSDLMYGDPTSNDDPNKEAYGKDNLNGDEGNDYLFGGKENDILNGNSGTDVLNGEDDRDILNGGDGTDQLFGGNDNDTLLGGSGADQLFGGTGDDVIRSGFQNDRAFGQEGNDAIYGGDGNDLIYGDRNDRIRGPQGKDTLSGEAGDDTLIGGALSDSLSGGTGKDRLIGVDPNFPELEYGLSDIDILTGGEDIDAFVLGQVANGSDVVFYNDGNPDATGTGGYALITDFTLGVDKIEFAGSSDSYSLGSSPSGLPAGTGIFFNESTPELVGVVEGIEFDELNLADTNQFTFV